MSAAANLSFASKRTLVDSDSDGEYQENIPPPKKRSAPSKGKALAPVFSTPAKSTSKHTEASLSSKNREDLVKIILDLQDANAALSQASATGKAPMQSRTAQQLAQLVSKQRISMVRGISKSMNWKRKSRKDFSDSWWPELIFASHQLSI
jgi:hypothetical protein